MPAPESNRELLKLNTVSAWWTGSSAPGAGSYLASVLAAAHDLVTVLQVDIRVTGEAYTYQSVGGTAIAAADGEWKSIPIYNALETLSITIAGAGVIDVVLWGAKVDQ